MKQVFLQYRNLIPVFVLAGFSIYTFLCISAGLVLVSQHYIGFMLVMGCIFTWFFARKYFRFVAIGTLVLGLFNLACFTPAYNNTSLFVKIGSLKLSVRFQYFSFYMLLFYVLLNLDVFKGQNEVEESPVLRPLSSESVNAFRGKYAHLDHEELLEIVQDKRYVPEARQAARELMQERENK